MIPKQDRQGVRQAKEIEQKYDLDKDYNELVKLAADAQRAATNAQNVAANAHNTAKESESTVSTMDGRVSALEKASTVFVNYADIVHTLEGVGQTWAATQNCYCVASLGAYAEAAEVYVDGALVLLTGLMTSETMTYTFAGNFYVKSGQVVSTKNVSGQAYNLKFYSLYVPENNTEGTEEE